MYRIVGGLIKSNRMKNLLCLVLALSLLGSCKKKYYEHTIQNATIREAATVNIGSYFVYATNDTEPVTDSFNVYSYINSGFYNYVVTGKDGPYHSYQILEYSMVNNVSDSIGFKASGHSSIDSGYLKGYVSSVKDTFQISAYYVVMPFVTSPTIPIMYDGQTTAYAIKHYDSLSLNGSFYTEVYEMLNQSTNEAGDTLQLRTFYSVNAGLVKYEKKKAAGAWATRELLRSNIIR